MCAFALPRESRSSEICVEINTKREKHPQHIDRPQQQVLQQCVYQMKFRNGRGWIGLEQKIIDTAVNK